MCQCWLALPTLTQYPNWVVRPNKIVKYFKVCKGKPIWSNTKTWVVFQTISIAASRVPLTYTYSLEPPDSVCDKDTCRHTTHDLQIDQKFLQPFFHFLSLFSLFTSRLSELCLLFYLGKITFENMNSMPIDMKISLGFLKQWLPWVQNHYPFWRT